MDYFFRSGEWIEEDRFKLLKETALFDGLSSYDFRQLADLIHESHYEPGERIFTEGDPSTAFYIIEEGSVRLFRTTDEHDEIEVIELEDGDFFGELALCTTHNRSTSAEAKTECVLLGMFRQEIEEFVYRETESGLTLMKNLVDIVGQRLLSANDRAQELKLKLDVLSTDDE